jgi:large subunit ribosomal protein L2
MCVNKSSFKSFKPHTPGMRQSRLLKRCHLLKVKPLKSKTFGYAFSNGRNNLGQITSWHKGGGHKRLYRKVDFYRNTGQGLVEGIEYDPNRSPWIHRLFNPDNYEHNYILGIKSINSGHLVRSFNLNHIKLGSHLILKDLPYGFVIHNLSSGLNKKGQYLRSAGVYGIMVLKTLNYARIKLRSGEHRYFPLNASASLGAVCNEDHKFTNLGKAGRKRWYGIRPNVRGVAINPVDHPHGGGEGKTSGGRPSVTPWGKPTKGQPTRTKPHILRLSKRKKKKKK